MPMGGGLSFMLSASPAAQGSSIVRAAPSTQVTSGMRIPSASFLEALAHIPVLRLQFAHRFAHATKLPPFKGGLWHGLLGASLHDVSESAFQCLFAPDQSRRLWTLRAPLQHDVRIPSGTELDAELILFGDAVAHSNACIDAFARMGERGFGAKEGRLPATVTGIAQTGQNGKLFPVGSCECRTLSLNELVASTASEVATDHGLRVELLSPLHLSAYGQLVKHPPGMELLLRRLLGRLRQLGPATSEFQQAIHSEVNLLLERAAQVELVDGLITHWRWNRYSARQHRTMPLEGIQGTLTYGAPAAWLYPWLKLAEWTHLGAKTSFGLGAVRIEPHPSVSAHHSDS